MKKQWENNSKIFIQKKDQKSIISSIALFTSEVVYWRIFLFSLMFEHKISTTRQRKKKFKSKWTFELSCITQEILVVSLKKHREKRHFRWVNFLKKCLDVKWLRQKCCENVKSEYLKRKIVRIINFWSIFFCMGINISSIYWRFRGSKKSNLAEIDRLKNKL